MIDADRVTVSICDEHADSASPKTAKEAYLKIKDEFEKLKSIAAAFGCDLVQHQTAPNKLAIATQQPLVKPAIANEVPAAQRDLPPGQVPGPLSGRLATPTPPPADGQYLDSQAAADILRRHQGNIRVSAEAKAMAYLQQEAPIDQSTLAESAGDALRGKTKLAKFRGRIGTELVLPTKIINGLGITNIAVVNHMSSSDYERRFKDMAKDSIADNLDRYKDGYHTVTCPACDGKCMVSDRGVDMVCPRCSGSGVFQPNRRG